MRESIKEVCVTQEDADNYCRIMSLLGMEEEGDPVAEVERLLSAPPAPEVEPVALDTEADSFEEWARGEKLNMELHPLHYLFLDSKTYAARQGWKAGVKFGAALHPANDGLRKAAEEVAQDLEGLTGWPRLQQLGKKLRAELDKP